ncbi:hypothetical protein Rhopal_002879-T1 [Rhodotorula paludigena]|uniref:Major facilitator superfamily (MFS) profile domain-containing protein n=1 Tax=Rhodotorula paludigena TaxID=86838 RepID=A0AAV5GJ51_9BASI|nr:hypothetical protein Rhopal_002879-T1 [Rhodotorula paludigena]
MPHAPETVTQASIGPIEGVQSPPPVDPLEPESDDRQGDAAASGSSAPAGTLRELASSTLTLQHSEDGQTGSTRGDKRAGAKGARRNSGGGADIEKGASTSDEGEGDVIVVQWKGDDDPECPLNWSFGRRMLSTFCVAGFTLLAPLSSSTMAPAAGQIADKLNVTSEIETAMLTSIFVLAFAIGPLVFGPASELFGRIRVLQLANILYLIFNLVCAFAKTKQQFIVFRFFAGFGGGAPLSVGAGVLSDLWRAEERGKGAALYSLGPLLGPAIGPVIGGWIVDRLPNDGYRWIFFSTTIFSALVQVVGLFGLRETYGPILLQKKAAALRREMGLSPDSMRVQTAQEAKAGRRKTRREVVTHGMLRPFALISTEPILMLFTAFLSVIYGCIYLLLTTTTEIYQGTYGQSIGIASTHFVALAIGFMLASQVGARYLDVLYRQLKAKEGGQGRPEFRLPLILPAAILLPLGLLLYGWGAEKALHWIVPDIGMGLIGFAMICIFQSTTSFILDVYTMHAASALATTIFFRSMCGCFFPWFAPYMYAGIGYGWGMTALALVTICIGWPAVPLMWFFGERLRARSKYVAKAQAK